MSISVWFVGATALRSPRSQEPFAIFDAVRDSGPPSAAVETVDDGMAWTVSAVRTT